MKYSYFYLVCLLTIIDFILLIVALRHRKSKAVNSLIYVVFLVIISHVFYGASLVIKQPEIKFFVHELKFVGVVYFSVAFFNMYMVFFGKQSMLKKRNIILLSIVPSISLLLAMTNNYHHLFRAELYIVENSYGSFVGVQSGRLFWPYIIYSYTVFVSVICIVIRSYLRTPKIYRVQLGIMIFAAVATLIINFISISGVLFEDFGDATLISFTFAAIIQFYGLVLYRPAKMIMMARGLAVNETRDPLIAFDYNGFFLDANIAANDLFELKAGHKLEDFLKAGLGFNEVEMDSKQGIFEHGDSWLSVKIKKIFDGDGAFALSVVSITNITETKNRELMLEDIANNDYLTGIGNRRAYQSELKRLRDSDLPASIAHFNISGMKAINSYSGNGAGDEIIKRVASVLADVADNGFCARIGGDEFALLLKNTAQEEAISVINDIETRLNDVNIVSGLAVKHSNLDNISLIDKLSMDNMYMNKLIGSSGATRRKE